MGNLRWNGFCFGDVGKVGIVGAVGKVAGIKIMKPAFLYGDMDRVICADHGPWSVVREGGRLKIVWAPILYGKFRMK